MMGKQAGVLKTYPLKLSFTALQCLLSSIQSFVVAIFLERDGFQWKLGWNIRLLAVAYCGFVVTGFAFYLQTWVIERKGPFFLGLSTPSAFIFTTISAMLLLGYINGFVVTGFAFYLQTWVIERKGPVFLGLSTPSAFIFTTISAALLLGEITSLGSVIGGILLIGGLYMVLWGKRKEEKEEKEERFDNKVSSNSNAA